MKILSKYTYTERVFHLFYNFLLHRKVKTVQHSPFQNLLFFSVSTQMIFIQKLIHKTSLIYFHAKLTYTILDIKYTIMQLESAN